MFYYLLNNEKLDMNKKRFNVDPTSIHKLDLKNMTIERIY